MLVLDDYENKCTQSDDYVDKNKGPTFSHRMITSFNGLRDGVATKCQYNP